MLGVVEGICYGLIDWYCYCMGGWVGLVVVVYGDGFCFLLWVGIVVFVYCVFFG